MDATSSYSSSDVREMDGRLSMYVFGSEYLLCIKLERQRLQTRFIVLRVADVHQALQWEEHVTHYKDVLAAATMLETLSAQT